MSKKLRKHTNFYAARAARSARLNGGTGNGKVNAKGSDLYCGGRKIGSAYSPSDAQVIARKNKPQKP